MISVVIVTWNVAEVISSCLQSVNAALQGIASEIIVVDNDSSDDTVAIIRNQFPRVELIHESRNWGYGKGNNIGISRSRGDYVLILNPDTLVTPSALQTMLARMQSSETIGFVGPQILNKDGSFQAACRRTIPTPQSAFFQLTGLSMLFPRHPAIARYQMGGLDPDQSIEVEAISGSCMLLRRIAIGTGFDERYFMYAEDLDMCLEIRKKGYRGFYDASALITHLHRHSSRKAKYRMRVHFYYSAYLFFKKHYGQRLPRILFMMISLALIFRGGLALCMECVRSLYSSCRKLL